MTKYKIIYAGEEEDDVFDTEQDAIDMALYWQSCERTGAEELNMFNPGDWEYDEDTFEPEDFEIIEIEE